VLDAVASAVLAIPGVVRLQPTLSTSGPGLLIHRNPSDGIRFLTRAGTAEVDVSIATTTAACEARGVVHHVRATVADVLIAHGHRPGTIAVSVLAVEPVRTASNLFRQQQPPRQQHRPADGKPGKSGRPLTLSRKAYHLG